MFRKLMIVAAAGLFIAGAMAGAQAQVRKYSLIGSAWMSINGQPHRLDVRSTNASGVDDARVRILNSRLQVCGHSSKVIGASVENGVLKIGYEGWWMGQPVVYTLEVKAENTLQSVFKLEAIGARGSQVFHNGRPLAGFIYLLLY